MSQWKSYANVAGAPKWGASIIQQGSGAANKAANNNTLVINSTPGAWLIHGKASNDVDGIFPVTPANKANTNAESGKVHGLGWAMRTSGEGPVSSVVAAANGSGFANGETVTVSGGSVNGTITLTTNATGNLASGVITTAGLFPNTSSAVEGFNREQHVANVNVTGTASAGAGNANVIVLTIGNTNITNGVVAVGRLVSNSTGGITNTQTQAIAWSGNTPGANNTGFWGLFGNTQTNTAITSTFLNANGSPVTGLTISANLVTSSGGNTQSRYSRQQLDRGSCWSCHLRNVGN